MRNILIAVVAVLVFNAIFVYSGGLELLVKTEQRQATPERIAPDVVDVFRFTLQEAVQKKIGTPVEGYEPQMFMQVFPGLTETDFEGVSASIGYYTIQEGRLILVPDNTQPVHSAAGSIGRDGVEVLLHNVANRTGVNLSADGTITDIMSALIAQ